MLTQWRADYGHEKERERERSWRRRARKGGREAERDRVRESTRESLCVAAARCAACYCDFSEVLDRTIINFRIKAQASVE